MTDVLDSLRDTLLDPHRLHAALVHLPIGAAIFGLALAFALGMTRGRSDGLRWACVLVFVIGAAGGFAAARVGEDAVNDPETRVFSDAAQESLGAHQRLGEKAWMFLAGAAALVGLSALRNAWARLTTLVLGLLVAVASVAWVGVTAHHGGVLVYEHGVGVPETPNNIPPSRRSPGPNDRPGPPATQPGRPHRTTV